jgi:NAD(P)-dependent dehydrogenase (short-subunit alcohol dehydrogenase family)
MTNTSRRPLLITGGTGGLGQAVVQRLLKEYRCILLYRSTSKWEALQQGLEHEYLHGLEADLLDESAVRRAVEKAHSQWGPMYGLVHLAGGFEAGTLEETTLDTWNKMIELNLTSAFIIIHAVLPQLHEFGTGRIITVSSAAAAAQPPGIAAYTITKTALQTLTQTLARELKKTRITANTLLPASMDTPAMREFASRDTLVPLERVAGAIAFLLSDEAASITGASIPLTVTGDVA